MKKQVLKKRVLGDILNSVSEQDDVFDKDSLVSHGSCLIRGRVLSDILNSVS